MRRGKKLAVILLSLFGGAALLVVLLGLLVYRSLFAPFGAQEPPPELREARVLGGAQFLHKSVFYKADEKGSWRDWLDAEKLKRSFGSNHDLAVGQLDGRPGLDVGLAHSHGLTILDRRGQLTKHVNYQFEKGAVEVGPLKSERERDGFYQQRVIDIEGDGVCEVLGYGLLDGMAVFNHEGRVVLSRGADVEGKPAIKNVSAGDVDGDGVSEFVAAWGYNPSGVELFDRSGKSLWRQKEEYVPGPFEVVDVDGDGKNEIVEDDGSNLKIRDAKGDVISTVQMPAYLWNISLCPTADGKGPPQSLTVRDGSVWLVNLDGQNLSKFDAPLSTVKLEKPREVRMIGSTEPLYTETEEAVSQAAGAWVRLKQGQPKYLAVVGDFVLLDRAMLYVYDAEGKLVYHELLPEESSDLAVLPAETDAEGAEELLVSGEKTVWRYAAR